MKHVFYVNMEGGPLHRQVLEVGSLPQVNIFCSPRDRIIYAYTREEMTYTYDADLSKELSGMYDQAVERFKPLGSIPIGEA